MKKSGAPNNDANVRIVIRADGVDSVELEVAESEVSGSKLPFWPQEVWGMPNALARSALFAVFRRGDRRVFNEKMINSRTDGDADVFLD